MIYNEEWTVFDAIYITSKNLTFLSIFYCKASTFIDYAIKGNIDSWISSNNQNFVVLSYHFIKSDNVKSKTEWKKTQQNKIRILTKKINERFNGGIRYQ